MVKISGGLESMSHTSKALLSPFSLDFLDLLSQTSCSSAPGIQWPFLSSTTPSRLCWCPSVRRTAGLGWGPSGSWNKTWISKTCPTKTLSTRWSGLRKPKCQKKKTLLKFFFPHFQLSSVSTWHPRFIWFIWYMILPTAAFPVNLVFVSILRFAFIWKLYFHHLVLL